MVSKAAQIMKAANLSLSKWRQPLAAGKAA
jgi:hypothetical protein